MRLQFCILYKLFIFGPHSAVQMLLFVVIVVAVEKMSGFICCRRGVYVRARVCNGAVHC